MERVEYLERRHAEVGLAGEDLLDLALMYVEPLHEEDKAIHLLEGAVRRNADDWVARVWLAYLYLHHRMDDGALRAGQQLLSPLTHQQGEPAAAAFLLLSQIGRDLGELDANGQAALLEESVKQAPDWVLNHYLLADCYRQIGTSDAALRELSEAEANIATARELHSKVERDFEGAITARTAHRIEDQLAMTRQKIPFGNRAEGGRCGSTGAVVAGLAVVSFAVLLVAVESNLLTRRSTEFSLERFQTIEAGDQIEDVAALLGEPILIRSIAEGTGTTDTARMIYYFMGEAPAWWPFYTEAMVVTDRDGVVVRKLLNEEP